jgi:hypothetical protein
MHAPGLDRDGFIRREGDLTLVPQAFMPVVDAAKTAILDNPERREQMELAAEAAQATTADREALGMLIDDLGPWLAAEYLATHGRKTPRP